METHGGESSFRGSASLGEAARICSAGASAPWSRASLGLVLLFSGELLHSSEQMPLNQPRGCYCCYTIPEECVCKLELGFLFFGQSVEETIKDNRYLR